VDIDLVYTWVEGNDPGFQRRRAEFADPSIPGVDLRPRRWRSRDELRYSLRSIARFSPWVRTIHIVTNGQRPAWLDCRHPKIRLVTHEQIYRWPEHLPTFSSTSIETHLHRIPNLAEHFIYANDDTFLGAPVEPDDFFTSLGFILAHPGRPLTEKILRPPALQARPRAGVLPRDPTYAGMLNALLLLESAFPGALFHWPDHQMKPCTRALYRLAESQFPAAFETTSANRFRCATDVAMNYALLPNLAIHARLGLFREKTDIAVRIGSQDHYRMILRDRPKFFCIHDQDEDDEGLETFLRELYPEPSEFEVRER
jgi:hypothetical protein